MGNVPSVTVWYSHLVTTVLTWKLQGEEESGASAGSTASASAGPELVELEAYTSARAAGPAMRTDTPLYCEVKAAAPGTASCHSLQLSQPVSLSQRLRADYH